MNTAERIAVQLNAKRVREGQWRANCPCCGGKRGQKFSIKKIEDGVLVHCFAGCSLNDILTSLGMTSAAQLYDSVSRTRPDSVTERKARAIRNLEKWCAEFLTVVCKVLRHIDHEIEFAARTIRLMEDRKLERNTETEEMCWSLLHKCVMLRQDAESYFEILNGTDLQAKLELWRSCNK